MIENMITFFEQRGIDGADRVPKQVLKKARQVICRLDDGNPYWKLRGKRLNHDRDVISIPVGRRWRILALWQDGEAVPQAILSHERYNGRNQ
ncbi:MAG: hypothetical protein ISS57_14535 [Anaerolineales bacterium]|nr:hypothetical protein [Anaerolineales bacterium]